MVLCHEKRCIFIHIPKTAGTSIEHYISEKERFTLFYRGISSANRSMHHYTAIELQKMIPQYFREYYKFSIVRNPYERLLSEYYWTPLKEAGYKHGKSKDDFLKYVSHVIKNKTYFDNIYNDHFLPQYLFVMNKKKQIIVNHLFKYEDLDYVSSFLKKKLNIQVKFPYLNKTKDTNEKEPWSEEQKDIIYELYKNDFIFFGYPKDSEKNLQRLPEGLLPNAKPLDLQQADGACEK